LTYGLPTTTTLARSRLLLDLLLIPLLLLLLISLLLILLFILLFLQLETSVVPLFYDDVCGV
jgi:hypothetical protein